MRTACDIDQTISRRHFCSMALAFGLQTYWLAGAGWSLALGCGIVALLAAVVFPSSGPSVDYRILWSGWAYGLLLANLVGILSISFFVAAELRVPITLPLTGSTCATMTAYFLLAIIGS